MSGRMNWDRVNRENRAWREARRAPSGSWEPDDSGRPPEVDRWPRAEAKRRRPKTKDKDPTVPWGMGTSKKALQRRRCRERAERAPAGSVKPVTVATTERPSHPTQSSPYARMGTPAHPTDPD